jgi:phosphoglycerate dehydrogenase-like enzyme
MIIRSMRRVAILDDYQNVALRMADWSPVADRAEITVFTDHVSDPAELVERLRPFDAVMVMRERTPLPRTVIEQLPRLRMIASTGPFNAAIDTAAAEDHGIRIGTTGGSVAATVELTWALILAGARRIVDENCPAGRWACWGWAASARGSPRSAPRSACRSSPGART